MTNPWGEGGGGVGSRGVARGGDGPGVLFSLALMSAEDAASVDAEGGHGRRSRCIRKDGPVAGPGIHARLSVGIGRPARTRALVKVPRR